MINACKKNKLPLQATPNNKHIYHANLPGLFAENNNKK